MTARLAIPLRRALAYWIDCSVLIGWGGLVWAVVLATTNGTPSAPASAGIGQIQSLLVMTLPFLAYLSLCERSRQRGTIGKRVLGLEVASTNGTSLSFARIVLRNAGKLLPWEFGHLAAHQMIHATTDEVPPLALVGLILSAACSAWWLVGLLVTGRTPYDGWAGARVGRRPPRE